MRKFVIAISSLLLATFLFGQKDFYALEHIPEIKIIFEQKNWNAQLDSLKSLGTKERIPATVIIDKQIFKDVGVRYKGNSSYNNPKSKGEQKLPFNLKLDFKNKDQMLTGGITTIKLSNVFQDASFLREVLSYEIARKYMPAPRCNFAKVFVNDAYIGLYNNTEDIDTEMLEEYFGTSKNTFFKCDPEWEDVKDLDNGCPEGDKSSLMYLGDDPKCYEGWYELESKKDGAWQELITLIKTLNQHPEHVDTLLDVDMALWMHAFNNVVVNLDSYTGRLSHNYYLYKTPDGLFTPLIWDMNISFGGFRYDGEKKGVLTDEELQTFSMFAHYKNKNPKRPLIVNLLNNPLWRKIYVGHCRTIVMENFAQGQYLELAGKIRSLIDEAVKSDPNKLYSYADFQKNLTKSVDIGYSSIIGIEELMKPRTEYLLKHPLFTGKNPIVSEVVHEFKGDKTVITATVKDAEKAYLAYRHSEKEPFKMLEMYVDGTPPGGGENDKLWRQKIDKKEGTQYYVIAEGDRLAVCSPERASHEFYTVK
ncbi:MAG: CotH kinase family protein [Lewinellaceae bacterium]|nr:CotH kinase family protein [Saprospiraceae bacterium]MCB9339528.1 CotH kinase family protein [Lewinellaceae bacterium]